MGQASLKIKLYEMDLIGTLLILGADVCLIICLQKAGITESWSSSVTIGLLVGFGVLFILFYVAEWRLKEYAMISYRLLRNRVVAVNYIFTFFLASNYFVTLYYLPIYFQVVHNTSPIASGVHNLPYILSFTLFMICGGTVLSKYGYATVQSVIGSVLVVLGTGLMIRLDVNTSTGTWIGYQICAGAGIGLTFQIPASAVQMILPPLDIATGSSMIICKWRYFSFVIILTRILTSSQTARCLVVP